MLGIYSAADGTGFSNIDASTGPLTLYLVATGLTDPSGIQGWECSVHIPAESLDQIFLTGIGGYGGIPWYNPPEITIGLITPLLPDGSGAIVLNELYFFFVSGSVKIWLRPVTRPSIPGAMVYVPGLYPIEYRPFNWSSGDVDKPVFGINTGPLTPPISSENATWGGMKALYR